MPQQQIYVIIYPLLTAWADHYTLIGYIQLYIQCKDAYIIMVYTLYNTYNVEMHQ